MRVDWAPLSDLIRLDLHPVNVKVDERYRCAGVLNRGRGLFDKGILAGADTTYGRLFRLAEGQIVYSKLFGWEGSIAVVPDAFDGYFVSSEFPTFLPNTDRVVPGFLGHYLKSSQFTDEMARSTNGLGQRRQRVNVDAFLRIMVPIPSIPDQDRVADYLTNLAQHRRGRGDLSGLLDRLIAREVNGGQPTPIGRILQLQRRAVDIEAERIYREVGLRSFGKGLFIKEPVTGADLGGKRVFQIEEGDFIVSNVFGWEGAVGVAGPAHRGLIGSHRFMTWTPRGDVNVEYLRAYFRSKDGVARLEAASPGSAGRNRTLSIANFEAIEIPVPSRLEQDRIAAGIQVLDEIAATSKLADEVAAAILPAARNDIFNAMR